MDNMALMIPVEAVGYAASVSTIVANLATPSPKEVAVFATSDLIRIDLGSKQLVDSFGMVGTFPVGWTWAVYTGNAADGSDLVIRINYRPISMSAINGAPSKEARLFETGPVVARYVWLNIHPAHGAVSAATVGIAAPCRSFVPVWGREWGSGRGIVDTGVKERLMGGGFGINSGAIKSTYSWTFGDLEDAERRKLFSFLSRVGETRAMFMVEDLGSLQQPALINRFGMSVVGELVTKTDAGGTGNSSVVSDTSFASKCLLVIRPQQTNKAYTFGINSDPLTDNAAPSIDYGFFIDTTALSACSESGTGGVGTGSYVANTWHSISYEKGEIRYARGVDRLSMTLVRTVADIGAEREFWADSSFVTTAGSAVVEFYGPDGFSEGVHYGVFEKIEKYERLIPNTTKWNLSMEEWT